MDYKTIASESQAKLLNCIPAKWRLASVDKSLTDVTSVPSTCGLLTPSQLAITELTATQLLSKLHSGALTSVEVTEAFCGRAAIAHQLVNCLTMYFHEEALETARTLDEEFERTGKPVGLLHGLPVSIKDMYGMKGKTTTMGYVAWKDKTATEDSSIVAELRRLGAVFYVMTTMPQTGMALETTSNLWGRTRNPLNTAFGSGGSSGGEAVLIKLHGSPIGPSSDIGGSIRAPASFNGLYAIRPTAPRIPLTGMPTLVPGQISIKVSCGPVAHCMEDIRMFTPLLNAHPNMMFEPTSVPVPWREVKTMEGKLSFGIMVSDGVVTPHPPIVRGMLETAKKLRDAGHEVLEFEPPFDCWEAAMCAWGLYFQTGALEMKAHLASVGEPMIPALAHHLEVFKAKKITINEQFQLNTQMATFKAQFAKAASKTASKTCTGRPMDGLICPVSPCAGIPHDFPVWWGYTSLFNLIDYPSTVMPLKWMHINAKQDPKNESYVPKDNPFDAENWKIYDPELWKNQPITIQIVGWPYQDEDLIAVTEVADNVCNKS